MATVKIDKSFRHQEHINSVKALMTMCTTSAGLAIGSLSKAKVKITNTTNYMINGVLYQAASAEVTIPAFGNQALNTFCKYLISLNSSGTATITRGTIASSAAGATLPELPDGTCPIGYFQVQVTGASPFVPGTTELDAAGFTVTYVNFATMCL